MKKQILSLITAAVTAAMSLSVPAMPSAADDTVRIMCIGDSITDGYGVGGSYRKFLYHNLTEAGYSIDMVGAKGGGWTPTYTDEVTGESFSYDDENTGYSGYAIKAYDGRSGIYETLQETDCLSQDPDVVILQIGTNDVIDCHELDAAGERLTILIDYILGEISSDAVLYVTTIPDLDPNRSDVYSWFGNYRHSADWQTTYSDEEVEAAVQQSVTQYNNTVRETVTALSASHSNLRFGDVHSAITDVTTQLGDGVHPNNTGYKQMGLYWSGVVGSYLAGQAYESPTEAPTAEPTEALTEEPTEAPTEAPTAADGYMVDVSYYDADGNPAVFDTSVTGSTEFYVLVTLTDDERMLVGWEVQPLDVSGTTASMTFDTFREVDAGGELTGNTIDDWSAYTPSVRIYRVLDGQTIDLTDSCNDLYDENKVADFIPGYRFTVSGTETGRAIQLTRTESAVPTEAPTDAVLTGDVDENGAVGLSDVVLLQKYLVRQAQITPQGLAAADLSSDGTVNVIDLTLLRRTVLPIVNQA